MSLHVEYRVGTPLCQYLKNVPVGRFHRVEYTVNEVLRNILVEDRRQVAH